MLGSIFHLFRQAPCIFEKRVKYPATKFICTTFDLYKHRTKSSVLNIRDVLLRGSVIAFFTALLLWLAIFMYIAFYYIYVPTISHERPVHLGFEACWNSPKSVCSYPTAFVELTKRQQLLMQGQAYRIHLELEMPESPTNKELGMFMVCAEFKSTSGVITTSCRSAMLHYRSYLLDVFYKLCFLPLYLFGNWEEKQTVHVELFANYEEQNYVAVSSVLVEVKTKNIEIYSAKFLINAKFTGLRYLMYNWPILSATIGITTNLFFIAFICLISGYQILNSTDYHQHTEKWEREQQLPTGQDETDSNSSVESSFDESFALEPCQIENIIERASRKGSADTPIENDDPPPLLQPYGKETLEKVN